MRVQEAELKLQRMCRADIRKKMTPKQSCKGEAMCTFGKE